MTQQALIKTTVGDFFSSKSSDLEIEDHSLYVVKANDGTVLYVGYSTNPIERLWQHLGLGHRVGAIQGSESRLGFLIRLMWPESATWQIEFLTPGDVGIEKRIARGISREEWEQSPFLFQFFTYEAVMEDRPYYSEQDGKKAERRLIKQLHPCLNCIYNENPTPLPPHIERKLFEFCLNIPIPVMPWDTTEEET